MCGLDRYIDWLRKPLFLWVGLLMLLLVGADAEAKKRDDIFITAELSNKYPYQGEAVVLSYKLYSKSGDINYARRVQNTELDGGAESYLSKLQIDSRGRKEVVDGQTYYVFPLESYVLSFDKKGSYAYKGGKFDIGVQFPVVYEDPFWGRRRGYKTEKFELDVPQLNFKVKNVPSPSADFRDVNTVGEFTISTSLPPGDIILENPARAIITLKGRGILDEEVMPQYAEAFEGKNIRLKSMSESRSVYFDGRSVVSELSLDCEFIPLEKEVEIGSVKFKFFNPSRGKFEETKSLPVKVDVRSITSKVQTTDI